MSCGTSGALSGLPGCPRSLVALGRERARPRAGSRSRSVREPCRYDCGATTMSEQSRQNLEQLFSDLFGESYHVDFDGPLLHGEAEKERKNNLNIRTKEGANIGAERGKGEGS